MNIAVCAIAKNENSYINDWCIYHLNKGVNAIFLFDNNEPDAEYVGKFISSDIKKRVVIIPVNHFKQFQKQAYNDFYSHFAKFFDWCAFIDVDEFIYTTPGHSIISILQKIPSNVPVVRLNWQIFGDDGKLHDDISIPVYKRLVKKITHTYNTHAKCIIRGGLLNVDFASVHYPLINGKMPRQITPSLQYLPDSAKIDINTIDYKCMYLNHYMTKTWEEFKAQKMNRSDAALTRTLNEEYYFRINPATRLLIANHYK